ncbi:MAG: hypothetical protein A2Y66_08765 [Nitrospirae bacterium RBG_13_41_22]|nr:MAG: hypothetical protein A2Y66_08765 [Nitrospirae bacterium RBG_13_41_22]OHE57883.1 MAG: hypothetical protein A2Z47_06255 [Thermodesulfovibrio sp. RBG_19FT_COMBO_42_12]
MRKNISIAHYDLPGGRTRKILEVISVGIGGLVIAPFSLISNGIIKLINDCTAEYDTIAFTSGFDNSGAPKWLIAGLCDHFLFTPITAKHNAQGHKVKWLSNVKRDTVLNTLSDEQYQNIVMIGHGNSNSYYASDGKVTAEDILDKGIKKKKGALYQHTCGGGNGLKLREVLLEDPSKGYTFDRCIYITENYLAAWKSLFGKKPEYK